MNEDTTRTSLSIRDAQLKIIRDKKKTVATRLCLVAASGSLNITTNLS
jgi:hypothetical protein